MEGLSDWNWVIQCVVQLVVGHVPRLGEVPRAPALGTRSDLSRTRRPSWDSESILAFATLGGAERHASRSIFPRDAGSHLGAPFPQTDGPSRAACWFPLGS